MKEQKWYQSYGENNIIHVDHHGDLTVRTLSSAGDVLSIQSNWGDTYYYYDKKRRLKQSIEVEKARVYGGSLTYKVIDSLVTTYKHGKPIATIGEKTTIAYTYEGKRLISECKTSTEYGEKRETKTEYVYNKVGRVIEKRRMSNNTL